MFEKTKTLEQRKEVRLMEKQCCNASITELENGYRLEITGDEIKGKCKTIFEKCCTDGNIKNIFQCCGGSKTDKTCC